jgi:hypothetical protein
MKKQHARPNEEVTQAEVDMLQRSIVHRAKQLENQAILNELKEMRLQMDKMMEDIITEIKKVQFNLIQATDEQTNMLSNI